MTKLKIPVPEELQDPDCEKIVLGIVLHNALDFSFVPQLNPEYFVLPLHKAITQTIKKLFEKDRQLNATAIVMELKDFPLTEVKDLGIYLLDLLETNIGSTEFKFYLDKLRHLYHLRQMLKLSNQIHHHVALKLPMEVICDNITSFMTQLIVEGEQKNSLISLKDVVEGNPSLNLPCFMDTLKSYTQLQKNPSTACFHSPDSISTGYSDLDEVCSGLSPGNLVLLAARPGEGKTALALNMAYKTSFSQSPEKQPIPVGLISLEMTVSEIFKRILSMHQKMSFKEMSSLIPNNQYFQRLSKEIKTLPEKFPLFTSDKMGMDLASLKAIAHKMKIVHHIKLLIIDYVQLLHVKKHFNSRHEEVSTISRELKTLAGRLQIPILGLCQLSREAHSKNPNLSHLRESGSLEQDADMVFLLHKPQESPASEAITPIILNIAKNRHGPTKKLQFNFHKSTFTFTSQSTISTEAQVYYGEPSVHFLNDRNF